MSFALGWRNEAPADSDGVPSLTPSTNMTATPTFDAAFPGANALTADPSLVARANFTRNASSPGDLIWRVKWSGSANDRTVRIVAAFNCRIPSSCTQVSGDILSFSDASLEALQAIPAASWAPIPGNTDRYNLLWVISQDRACGGFQLAFRLNASSNGNVEIGTLWAGPAVLSSQAVAPDLQLGWVDGSSVQRGQSGGFAAVKLPARRRVSARIVPQDYTTAIGNPASAATESLRSAFQRIGLSSPCVIIPDDSTSHAMQTLGVYGALAQAPEISGVPGRYFTAPYVIEEIR